MTSLLVGQPRLDVSRFEKLVFLLLVLHVTKLEGVEGILDSDFVDIVSYFTGRKAEEAKDLISVRLGSALPAGEQPVKRAIMP